MTEYEILLLLEPELSEEAQADVVARTRALLEKSGGSLDRHDVWGQRKLAYEIDHKDEGWYHLLLLTCSAETLEEVGRVLRIDDGVMRHMATRRYETSPTEPLAVGASASQDAGETQPAAEED